MTDLEKLTALLSEFGVKFNTVTPHGAQDYVEIVCSRLRDDDELQTKITGYTGFFTVFTFRSDGSFVSIGAWE